MTISSENPHAHTIRQASNRLRELAKEIDGKWEFVAEKQGIKIYKQDVDQGKTMDMMRGDYVVKSPLSHKDFARIITNAGIRPCWDSNVDKLEEKVIYNEHEELVWAKYKTPWPVSSRDFCVVGLIESEDNESYVTMTSVEDSHIPAVKGCVRGQLDLVGWRIKQEKSELKVTYINHTDMGGSVPTSLMKLIQAQIPMCLIQAADFATKQGFPPYVDQLTNGRFEHDSFDPKKHIYTVKVSSGAELHLMVSRQMYPRGITVKAPNGSSYEIHDNTHTYTVIVRNASSVTISKAK
ncbi:hypothetical protein BJV82DRAFT_205821 [Fennellomyces sp. T-0311]|nr:hypothetical protein BJV82DRAFT_205821 [Fennellomyces sp. T-0311]